MVTEGAVIWYNPQCSKCISADELLAAGGVPTYHVRYLDDPHQRPVVIWANRAVMARPPELLLPLLERGEIG